MGAEDDIPEPTGNSKAILVVHEMVLEMVLLQFSPVCRQCLVVEEVMSQVVADVSEDAAAEDSSSNVPVPVKHGVS